MIGYFRIQPRSQAALRIVSIHGDVMGVDKQQRNEILLWCANPNCKCWEGATRYHAWFKLNTDVVLGNSVAMVDVQAEINSAESVVS